MTVAKGAGAEVLGGSWTGAYDTALNQLLDKVDTEWTLRIEPEEWLDPDSVRPLKEVTISQEVFMLSVQRTAIADGNEAGQFEMFRLWRTHPEIRYRGTIHEQIWQDALEAAAKGRKLGRTPIKLCFDVATEPASELKLRDDLGLIRRELELRPGQLFYEICLYDMLSELNDPEAEVVGEQLISRLIKNPNQAPTEAMIALLVARSLAALADDKLHAPRTGKLLAYAVQWLSAVPNVNWAVLVTQHRRQNFREALDMALRLETMGRTNNYHRGINFDPRIIGPGAWAAIVELAPLAGRPELVPPFQQKLAMLASRQAQAQSAKAGD